MNFSTFNDEIGHVLLHLNVALEREPCERAKIWSVQLLMVT